MKSKLLKYWSDVPVLYAFAFVLDPRAKMLGLGNLLEMLGEAVGRDYSDYCSQVRAKLSELYDAYEAKFGEEARAQRRAAPTSAGRRRMMERWMKLRGSASARSGGGDLAAYLDSDVLGYEVVDEEDFDVLGWWRGRRSTYPVLSLLARDVLTVPVSTVSSAEDAFSLAGGRVLEERRANLTATTSGGRRMVEVLTVVRDWEQAEARAQHTAGDKAMQAAFEDLDVDDDDQDG